MVPVNSSTSLQSSSKNTIGFHITTYFFSGSIYIDCFTFLTFSIYIYFLFKPYLNFTYRSTNILLIWLKVHQGIFFFSQPWFLRLMNVADTVILVNDNLLHNFCFVLIKYSLLLLCCL
ncbi:hypothetical protein Hanom_Chr00s000007g01614841 [Helianthus anomalus]